MLVEQFLTALTYVNFVWPVLRVGLVGSGGCGCRWFMVCLLCPKLPLLGSWLRAKIFVCATIGAFVAFEVPDLTRASLSIGLFMAQEEVKHAKEGPS